MKRSAISLVVAVSAMLLASCYFMTTRATGTIRLDLGGSVPKAISGSVPDRARIYLYSYISSTAYSLYPFAGGAEHYETAYPGTATLSNIPEGWWKVLVSVGTDQANGSFSTDAYGASEVVHVAAGSNTSASIRTSPSPFLDWVDSFGKKINGLTAQGGFGFLAATDGSNLYFWSTDDCDPLVPGTPSSDYLTVVPAPAGYRFNSAALDPSGYLVLVNTNGGVATYDLASLDSNLSQNLRVGGNPVDVRQSGGMVVTSPTTRYTLLYTSDRGFGGLSVSSWPPSVPPASTDWVSIDLSSGETAGPPVYQASMSTAVQGYGYIFLATELGAYWTTPDLVDAQAAGHGDFGTLAHPFSGPGGAVIQAVAVDSSGSVLYVGTPRGAYWTPITMTPRTPPSVSFGSWTSLDATSGDYIVEIQASGNFVAFRSLYNLYVLETSTQQMMSYPFYAGLPGKLSSMAWDDSVPALFLGGSSGIVILTDPYLPLGPQ